MEEIEENEHGEVVHARFRSSLDYGGLYIFKLDYRPKVDMEFCPLVHSKF